MPVFLQVSGVLMLVDGIYLCDKNFLPEGLLRICLGSVTTVFGVIGMYAAIKKKSILLTKVSATIVPFMLYAYLFLHTNVYLRFILVLNNRTMSGCCRSFHVYLDVCYVG